MRQFSNTFLLLFIMNLLPSLLFKDLAGQEGFWQEQKYTVQDLSNLFDEMKTRVDSLNKESEGEKKENSLKISNFKKTAQLIKVINAIKETLKRLTESGNIKWHLAVIFGLKRDLYDIYNARQAVDDNNEPIEGIIYITYDDSSFLFGGRKEKEIPDLLYGIPPSVEEIEAFRKGITVEELEELETTRKKEIEEQQKRWAKRAAAGILVTGLVDKIFDNPGVQEAIKNAMQSTKEATAMVKKSGARLMASISTKIKSLANQFQKTGDVSSKKLSAETQTIQQTVNQGLEGIKKAAKLGAEIKAGVQWKVDKAIGSVLDKLTGQEGTVLWEFEKEIKKAANLNDWQLVDALIGERNLVLVRTYSIIRKAIEAGKEITIEQVKELAKQNIEEGFGGKEAIERILKARLRGSL